MRRDALVVPKDVSLREALLAKYYDDILAGYFSGEKTLILLNRRF